MLIGYAEAGQGIAYMAKLSNEVETATLTVPTREADAAIFFDETSEAHLGLYVSTSVPATVGGFYHYDPASGEHSIVLNSAAYDLSTVVHESVHAAYFYLRYNQGLCSGQAATTSPCLDDVFAQEQLAYLAEHLVMEILASLYP